MREIYKIAVIVTLFTSFSIGVSGLTPEEEIMNVVGQNDINSVSDSTNNRIALPPNNKNLSDVINLSKVFVNHKEIDNFGCGFGSPKAVHSMRNISRSEDETQFAEFPWMVAILKTSFIAAGSLIAPNIVLTIANPFKNLTADGLKVVAGEWDVENQDEIMPHINRSVESIINHEKFDGFVNNIALLVLKVSFGRQPNIGFVCLPTPGATFDISQCLSTAWSHYKGKPKKIYFEPKSRGECARSLPRSYTNDDGSIDPSFSCTTFLKNDSAAGLNSGAALVCPMHGEPRRYTLAGITVGFVGREYIFVNMTHLMPWIYRNLGPRRTPLNNYLPFN